MFRPPTNLEKESNDYIEPPTLTIWLFGIWIGAYTLGIQRYESRTDALEVKANVVFTQLSSPNVFMQNIGLKHLGELGRSLIPEKPGLILPFLTFFKDNYHQDYRPTVKSIVEEWKDKIPAGSDFSNNIFNRAMLENGKFKKIIFSLSEFNGASMMNADFSESNFSKAILNGANLHSSNLYSVTLIDASLKEADLANANLAHSDLSSAILQNAILFNTNFRDAILSKADFTGATGLTYSQIKTARCFYSTSGIPTEIINLLEKNFPHGLKEECK
jgi:hypothetical protein